MGFVDPDADALTVALRKESVDRNVQIIMSGYARDVALRKESVDRNVPSEFKPPVKSQSLSARRAWIEMCK